MPVSRCNIPKAHAEFSGQIIPWFSEAAFACAAHPMMAASVPDAPEQSPFTFCHTAYASSLPHYRVHLPTTLHDNQLVCSVTAAFDKCISSFFESFRKAQRLVATEFPFTKHDLVSKIAKWELCLRVFVICSVFFCLFFFLLLFNFYD